MAPCVPFDYYARFFLYAFNIDRACIHIKLYNHYNIKLEYKTEETYDKNIASAIINPLRLWHIHYVEHKLAQS